MTDHLFGAVAAVWRGEDYNTPMKMVERNNYMGNKKVLGETLLIGLDIVSSLLCLQ
eukprot:CAMPEP_0116866416 /NCGR_PEP_ID=MMETSP0418-20121206/26009_1 /TAXON_ID=1158023 /ORGANISM="Astrosyne radiata, Strain 13vi08-1A" /LENGTH=55 /DNA_ID=CAMNT_0004502033 /DNA_START=609 /DNA_END=776 /DNA_ORIENTATION=+